VLELAPPGLTIRAVAERRPRAHMGRMSDPLPTLSAALAARAATVAPSLVAVTGPRVAASGFVWRPGLVVLPEEALGEAETLTVTPADGAARAARLLGRDPSTDVALLAVEGLDAPPAPLAEVAPPLASLALAAAATPEGPVAALGLVARAGGPWRSLRGGEIAQRLELDLRLRRSAEGALALDAEGRAFGMAVFGPRRRVLVIPAATVARAAEALLRDGRVARGWLGVALHPVALAEGGTGVMLLAVEPGGPAAAAGLLQGDVLTAWDGAPVPDPARLARRLGPDSVGRAVRVGFRRAGEARETTLTIGARP
jgi:S1-C subfamily serine protease